MQITQPCDTRTRAIPAGASSTLLLPIVAIVGLFFMWGVANSLNDILIRQFKKAFELSDFQSGLVQSAFYLGYFLFALPAGVFMRRFGYKPAVVLGLGLYAAGAFLFYPAAEVHTYGLFLLALFVIASGLAFLETSANPLMTVLGPPEGAERRLNLAQAFNPLGAITGVLIGRLFIFSGVEHASEDLAAMSQDTRTAYYLAESAAVQMPYLLLGLFVLLWAMLVAVSRFPPLQEGAPDTSAVGSKLSFAFRQKRLLWAVVAQFAYVGAQVGIWSYLIRYAQSAISGLPERHAADYLTISLVIFMIGRFAGAALMRTMSPARILAGCSLANVALMGVAIVLPGPAGLWALVGASFFMSIMFPTIFALGIRGLGEHRRLGSSLLVMAIIGGAVLTAAMGALSDVAGIPAAFSVPLLCFIVVLAFARSVLSDIPAAQ